MDPLRTDLLAFLSALLIGLMVPTGSSQGKAAPDSDAPPSFSVTRAAHGAALLDDGLWGAGPDYKIQFRRGGFELTPALGSAAPRNFPLAFELETIERGGVVVHAAVPAGPELGADGIVRYSHAYGIEERYETRADGVEQSFLFTEPLPGSGELVVRGRLTGELVAPLGEHEELEFTAPGLGGVRFGAVTGIDAAGNTAAGSLRYDGQALELTLPAELVDAAEYPLVLDPLIGTPFLIPSPGDYPVGVPDVAYDSKEAVYLVVWGRTFSLTDWDILAQRVSTSGQAVGGIIFVEISGVTTLLPPTVANVRQSRRFLVAWSDNGTGQVKARAVSAVDGSLSKALAVATGSGPRACGEQTFSDDDALLVWDTVEGIKGAQIGVPSIGNPVTVGLFTVPSGPWVGFPAIARSSGTAGRALVAYQSEVDHTLYLAVLDRDGVLLDGPKPVAPGGPPAIDGDGQSWLLAYAYADPLD